jgi:hypothetical protein
MQNRRRAQARRSDALNLERSFLNLRRRRHHRPGVDTGRIAPCAGNSLSAANSLCTNKLFTAKGFLADLRAQMNLRVYARHLSPVGFQVRARENELRPI